MSPRGNTKKKLGTGVKKLRLASRPKRSDCANGPIRKRRDNPAIFKRIVRHRQ